MRVVQDEKKNGKLVVAAVLGFVVLLSAIAWSVQQVINSNRGKPPRSQPAEAVERTKAP